MSDVESIQKAIAIIQECRNIHEEWRDYFRDSPEEMKRRRSQKVVAGDPEYQQKWIDNYDYVLNVLEEAKEIAPARSMMKVTRIS